MPRGIERPVRLQWVRLPDGRAVVMAFPEEGPPGERAEGVEVREVRGPEGWDLAG